MVVCQPAELVFFLKTNLIWFFILLCLHMPCAVNALTAATPRYGLALCEGSFPEHELHLKARVSRKDQCIFAIYKQLPINLIEVVPGQCR